MKSLIKSDAAKLAFSIAMLLMAFGGLFLIDWWLWLMSVVTGILLAVFQAKKWL